MIGGNRDDKLVQIKSIVVYQFLNEFISLEGCVKEIFQIKSISFSEENRQRMYFYLAGSIGTTIDSSEELIRLKEVKYKEDENFSQFSFAQIMRFNQKYSLMEELNFDIPSLRSKMTDLQFSGCATKLIKMRNKLAHDVVNVNFNDQDIIEYLSEEIIQGENITVLSNIDISLMDDMTRAIASNLIFLYKINVIINDLLIKIKGSN